MLGQNEVPLLSYCETIQNQLSSNGAILIILNYVIIARA